MTKPLFHWEIEGEYYGASHLTSNKIKAPVNLTFFCPKCGKIWARVYSPDVNDWSCRTARCQLHHAGAITSALPGYYPEGIPTSVLMRDLEIVIPFSKFGMNYYPLP